MGCEHDEYMIENYPISEFTLGKFCGDVTAHEPHGGCYGVFCDYGCNASDF